MLSARSGILAEEINNKQTNSISAGPKYDFILQSTTHLKHHDN